MSRRKNSLIGSLIMGPLLVVIGYSVAFLVGKPILDNARESTTWPSVTGTITGSEVKESRGKRNKTLYVADVRYAYQVEDRKRKGNTIWFGDDGRSGNSSDAYKTVDWYPVGKQVDVFYNPQDPAVSVLEPGAFFSSYILFGIGLLFLLGGLVLTGQVAFRIAKGAVLVGGAISK